MRRRILAVAATAAISAMTVGTVTAEAQGPAPDSVACSFAGSTTNLAPIPPASAVFPPFGANANPEEGTAPFRTADAGTYGFAGSPISCTGTDSNGNVHTATAITSSGTYYNISCGTGTAFGTATLTGLATVAYTIVFTAGQGELTADVTMISDGVTFDAAGTVTLTPTQGDCVTSAVAQFTAVGSMSGTGGEDTEP